MTKEKFEQENLPLITVAVPVYNAAAHLELCLDSIINQTYQNLEILIVNDGSTDDSVQICEEYQGKEPRIRIFHKKNGGVGATRNTLLELFTGDYITFVDNDDWLEKDHVGQLYEQLIKHEADISACNFLSYIEEKNAFEYHGDYKRYREEEYTPEEWFSHQYKSKDYMSQCFTVPWGKLYKRYLLQGITFPEEQPVEDDFTTYMIYLKAKKITYAHRQTYIHRKRSKSVTKTVNLTHVFPLQSIEERLALLASLGHDFKEELMAYRWRLELHQKEYLKKGDVVNYRRVSQKLALIKKKDEEG